MWWHQLGTQQGAVGNKGCIIAKSEEQVLTQSERESKKACFHDTLYRYFNMSVLQNVFQNLNIVIFRYCTR